MKLSITTERYSSLQVARLFAALFVLVGHTAIFTSQKYGNIGLNVDFVSWLGGYSVNLFFAISGFVIPASAQRLSAGEFILHRLARIYMGYFVAVIGILLIKRIMFGSYPLSEISIGALSLLPLGQIPYPLWIEWSLVFELFFYSLFAAIWLFKSNRVVFLVMMA